MTVRASFALYGAAIAVALAPLLQRRTTPGALPSGIAAMGWDAAGPMRQFAFIVAMALLFGAAATLVRRYVVERQWAMTTACIALASAPITLMHFGNVRHVLLHGVIAAAVVFLRHIDMRFSRADIVLLPVALAYYFAFLDLDFGHTPAATLLRAAGATLALRIAAAKWSRLSKPAYAFAAAPLAFVVQMQWVRPGPAGVIVVLWLTIVPFLLARAVTEERLRRFAMWIAYPIAVAAYSLALLSIVEPPHVDFFEDGHDLQPANEMLRGKVLYRDIIPIHGALSDGGLAWIVIKLGGDSAAAVLKTRLVLASFSVAAIYFVALAATGSAEAGLLAAFLALALFPAQAIWLRALFPLVTLACSVASVRLRNARWLISAGVALVLAALTSLDLAAASAIVAFVAIVRASDRARSLKLFAIGVAAAAVPSMIVFAAGGFLIDAFRVTLTEVLAIRSAYVIAPLTVPDCFRSLSGVVMRLTDRASIAFMVWVLALIGCAVVFGGAPLRARRRDATWLIAVWIVLAGASYVERLHFYLAFAAAAFLVSLLFRMLHGPLRQTAVALTILLALIAGPFDHIFNVATPLRRSRGLPRNGLLPFAGTRRSVGALFDTGSAAALGTTQRFLSTLKPGETFFDFANAGLLYYLFERETPIRYNSVMMYESEAAQREVIASLERRRVAAALIVFPSALSNVDDVPNRERAPLVWQYLQTHYTPALDENGVVFWRRR